MLKSIYSFFHRHYHLRYHGVYRHAKKLFVFDLGLMALALAMLATSIVLFFWKPSLAQWIDIEFSMGGERMQSGGEMCFSVDYINRSKSFLEESGLAIRLPAGFIVNRALSPDFPADSVYGLGKIKPGGQGEIKICGRVFTDLNKEEEIVATLTYRPENSKTREQKISAAFLKTTGSFLTADWETPTAAFPGRTINTSLRLINSGDQLMENLDFAFYGFKPVDENKLKNISLKPGETKIIPLPIIPPENAGKKVEMKIEIGLMIHEKLFRQAAPAKIVEILTPRLSSSASWTTEAPAFAEPGATLPLKLAWKNDGAFEMKNLKIRLQPTPGTVDLAASARENNGRVENGALIFDKSSRTALADGRPGQGEEFSVTLKLLPTFHLGGAASANLEIKIFIEGELAEAPGQTFSAEGQSARLPLATELFLTAEPRYYTADGDQLGRGPLPPKVGETTKYWILVKAANTSNSVSDNSFRAVLADGVVFTGRQSVSAGAEMKYDAGSRTLTWNSANTVPANAEVGLRFEVAVFPTVAQVGQKIILVKEAAYSAVDDLTGKKFNLRHGELNNVLSSDDRGRSSGAEVRY